MTIESYELCECGFPRARQDCLIKDACHYRPGAGIPHRGKTPVEAGAKFDAGKLPWHLLPWGSVTDVVRVLQHGAEKYAPDNWQLVPEARARYFSAVMRHLVAWQGGELIDPESGLPHLAHAATCLLFLRWFELRELERRGA